MSIECPDVYFNRFDRQLDEDNPEKMLPLHYVTFNPVLTIELQQLLYTSQSSHGTHGVLQSYCYFATNSRHRLQDIKVRVKVYYRIVRPLVGKC